MRILLLSLLFNIAFAIISLSKDRNREKRETRAIQRKSRDGRVVPIDRWNLQFEAGPRILRSLEKGRSAVRTETLR